MRKWQKENKREENQEWRTSSTAKQNVNNYGVRAHTTARQCEYKNKKYIDYCIKTGGFTYLLLVKFPSFYLFVQICRKNPCFVPIYCKISIQQFDISSPRKKYQFFTWTLLIALQHKLSPLAPLASRARSCLSGIPIILVLRCNHFKA